MSLETQEELTENVTPDPNLHHLMRVRVRRSVFVRLQEIARQESSGKSDYTSVSDLVRSALRNWIQAYESTERLKLLVNPSPIHKDE